MFLFCFLSKLDFGFIVKQADSVRDCSKIVFDLVIECNIHSRYTIKIISKALTDR